MITFLSIKLLSKIKYKPYIRMYLYYIIPMIIYGLGIFLSFNWQDEKTILESLKRIESILLITLFLYSFTRFSELVYMTALHKRFDSNIIRDCSAFYTNCGLPQTGKTSTQIYINYYLAQVNWADLSKEYFYCKRLFPIWKSNMDIVKLNHYEEVTKAYDFFMENIDTRIPCFYSNIRIEDRYGRINYKFDSDYMYQMKRLPYKSSVLYEEIGDSISVDVVKGQRPIEVSEMARFNRHFGEYAFGCTEQEPNNIYIDIRRNSKNRLILGQSPVLKPMYYNLVFNRFEAFCIKHDIKNEKIINFLVEFKTLIREMGMRHFKYVEIGNTEMKLYQKKKINNACIPYDTEFKYNDRSYYSKYRCNNKEFEKPNKINIEKYKESFNNIMKKIGDSNEGKSA